MGKSKGYKNPLKKNVTEIAAIIWLCTTILTIFLFDAEIGRELDHLSAVPVTAHNSAIDNVTDVIYIDIQDNLKINEDMISDISRAPAHKGYMNEIERGVARDRLAILILCVSIPCGIVMFIAFRKTTWLRYVYIVSSGINLFYSFTLFLGLICLCR